MAAPILAYEDLGLVQGSGWLFRHIDLHLQPRDRLALIGRNGAGKTTLLKLLAGRIDADEGRRTIVPGTKVVLLEQDPQVAGFATLHDWALHGDQAPERHEVEAIADQLGIDLSREAATASGGERRRAAIARALAQDPDVLLLDEPTNHLDIEAIGWLETFLKQFAGSILFVTHDRSFLRALATRIVEIDRGALTDWPGDYDNYLRRREERLHAEAQANALFDKKLAQEEVWIRQGIKARRTRNEGRVRALKALRAERAQRRELGGNVKMTAASAQASGKMVIELRHVHQAYDGRVLIDDLTTTVMRGDRIGIIGPNGAGKSTLLKIMLGELTPLRGTAELGTNIEIAYFDQHRLQLNDKLNALDNVAEGREFIELNGQRKHIIGYLQDFLFSPERARAPITRLSGGERNRLLLAKLFAQPSNLLVMDEPTNDLDVETLELLEELLTDYQGTLLLVSHDRAFLDNVVSSTLVLEGEGQVGEYVGGYTDWLRQRPGPRNTPATGKSATPVLPPAAPIAAKRKRSFKEQHELEQLPKRIEQLEGDIATRTAAMNEPAFFQQDSAAIVKANEALVALQVELDAAYARWTELDG